jgi:signal transduction histidine kinase
MQYNPSTKTWDENVIHSLGMNSLYEGYVIKIYDIDGNNVWDANNHDMTLCREILHTISKRMEEYGAKGDFVSKDYPLVQNGENIGLVSITYFGPYFLNENDFLFLNSLNLIIVLIGIASILVSFITGWILSQRIAHPITETANIAKEIASGNYNMKFEGKTKTIELYDLVSAINDLSSSLSKQESLRKHLTANVAHELRTPLTILGSHLEAMIENVWDPTPERLKNCHEEILRLSKMVADLELLEKNESANLNLNKEPIDLLPLIHSICDNFKGELKNKNINLEIDGDKSIINVDKDRISSVVINLVSNAIKYTDNGGNIHINIKNTENKSTIIIEDDGMGIPENELPFIFERFYRADKSRNRNTGGSGIGLAIVKSIVAAHGGNVSVTSKVDEGSRFVVEIEKG